MTDLNEDILKRISEMIAEADGLSEQYWENDDEDAEERIRKIYHDVTEISKEHGLEASHYDALLEYAFLFPDRPGCRESIFAQVIKNTENCSEEFYAVRMKAFRLYSYMPVKPQKAARILIEGLCCVPVLQENKASVLPEFFAERAETEKDLADFYLKNKLDPVSELHLRQSVYLFGLAALSYPDRFAGRYIYAAERLGGAYNKRLEYEKAFAVFSQMKNVALEVQDNKQRIKYLDAAISGINETGVAYGESGYHEKSLDLFLEALGGYNSLSEDNCEYLKDAAMLQNNIGYLYTLAEKYGEAKKMLDDALKTYERVRETAAEEYSCDLTADVYCNMAVLCLRMEEYGNAVKSFKAARGLYEKALKEATRYEKNDILGRYATVLNNLGAVYRETGKPLAGVASLWKSLRIRKKLVRGCSEDAELQSGVSDCYVELGKIFSGIMPSYSIKLYGKAVKIREKISAADPARYIKPLYSALEDLISFYGSNPERALKKIVYVQKAIAVLAKLEERDPEAHKHNKAQLLADLAECQLFLLMYDEALNSVIDSLLLFNEIEKEKGLDSYEWAKMMGAMVSFITVMVDYKNDKRNAQAMTDHMRENLKKAPADLLGRGEYVKIVEEIERIVAEME